MTLTYLVVSLYWIAIFAFVIWQLFIPAGLSAVSRGTRRWHYAREVVMEYRRQHGGAFPPAGEVSADELADADR